jgi:hypothetical protein
MGIQVCAFPVARYPLAHESSRVQRVTLYASAKRITDKLETHKPGFPLYVPPEARFLLRVSPPRVW